jgi:hypothetical protein
MTLFNRRKFYMELSLSGPLLLAFALAAGLPATALAAAEIAADRNINEGPAPEAYQPVGGRLGAFMLYPNAGVGFLTTDNVFATEDDEVDDVALVILPELKLTSNASDYRAEIGANAELAKYADYSTEDYADSRLWLEGEKQFGNSELSGDIRLNNLHQNRTSADDQGIGDLTEFDRNTLSLAYVYQPGLLFLGVDGRLTDIKFGNTRLSDQVSIDNGDRDRRISEIGFLLGFESSPTFSYFGEVRIDDINYDDRFDRDGFERSSKGFELRVGGIVDLTNLLTGEFYVGFLQREYDDIRFQDADGPGFGAELEWRITQLTTLSFRADRTIGATTVEGASGIFKTLVGFGVRHELRRNFTLEADLYFLNDDFDDIGREDDIFRFEIGGRYFMSRNMNLAFGYRFQDRESSAPTGNQYEINNLYVRFLAQF